MIGGDEYLKVARSLLKSQDATDEEIASLSQKNNIHIAVDLKGYTLNSRAGIFHHNPAPIKINYLGYPGTLGTKYYNYIIADKTVLPQKEIKNFAEEISKFDGNVELTFQISIDDLPENHNRVRKVKKAGPVKARLT